MSAYRFCRTDDVALLVDALNRCRPADRPFAPPMTPAAFKRAIRDRQVWCSSCMVAFEGADPVGVLIGAKRPTGTLVHTIAVHPDHRRRGHGRHLLASLGSKLAILGPPRIVAEVPETLAPACELFSGSGYVPEVRLTDYTLACEALEAPEAPGWLVVPITVDDLAANGLLETYPPTCWERSVESLIARKNDIMGIAVASDERIEACVLFVSHPEVSEVEILSLRSFVEDRGARVKHLLSRVPVTGPTTFWFPKVHPSECAQACLDSLGFRAVSGHVLYAGRARSDQAHAGVA
jgi:GNAT superfamily N-acetyltransferase